MAIKTYEISVTAIFTVKTTEALVNIIKEIESSDIICNADEYNINTNIIVNNLPEGAFPL